MPHPTQKIAVALMCATLATTAAGQDWALQYGDLRMSETVLAERLTGRIVTFYDNGRSEYYEDGRYTYTYANEGGTAYGYWSVNPDGAVCIEFVNGFSRCDLYVMDGSRMVLLDEKGDRYPVRPEG